MTFFILLMSFLFFFCCVGIYYRMHPELELESKTAPSSASAAFYELPCPYCAQPLVFKSDLYDGYTVYRAGETSGQSCSTILLNSSRKLHVFGDCPACRKQISIEFALDLSNTAQQEESPEGAVPINNTLSLRLLFMLLERTIFICDHNIRNNLGDCQSESFWKRYCETYIAQEMASSGLASLDESPDAFQKLLLRRAKMVYDMSLLEPPGHNPDSSVEEHLESMSSFVQNMEKSGTESDLRARDNLRDWMENTIRLVFEKPEEAASQIIAHWSHDTMDYLKDQDTRNGDYSIEEWRMHHPADFLAALEQMAADSQRGVTPC